MGGGEVVLRYWGFENKHRELECGNVRDWTHTARYKWSERWDLTVNAGFAWARVGSVVLRWLARCLGIGLVGAYRTSNTSWGLTVLTMVVVGSLSIQWNCRGRSDLRAQSLVQVRFMNMLILTFVCRSKFGQLGTFGGYMSTVESRVGIWGWKFV